MIASFELDGKAVLGFDTGLDAGAFARAKLGQYISHTGSTLNGTGISKIKTAA
jgi:hypothetical protein